MDEDQFAKLYCDEPSRSNTPVNVLVELEVIKAGFEWSDEELYDAFVFNLQVQGPGSTLWAPMALRFRSLYECFTFFLLIAIIAELAPVVNIFRK